LDPVLALVVREQAQVLDLVLVVRELALVLVLGRVLVF
jgi:hypothetical protein